MARTTLASLEARIAALEALAAASAPASAPKSAPATGTAEAPLYVGKKRPCPHCSHAPMGPTGLAWHIANIHK